jgi:hypothetical protein
MRNENKRERGEKNRIEKEIDEKGMKTHPPQNLCIPRERAQRLRGPNAVSACGVYERKAV